MENLIELSKEFRFEAAHRLPYVGENHKCARLHGHSFRATINIRGPLHPQFGWVIDYEEISRAFQPLHDALDHRYLNEIKGLENPTSENIALYIIKNIKLPIDAKLHSVSVRETCTASCTAFA